MKRLVLMSVLVLAACESAPTESTSFREFMVIGNGMTFEQCRAGGGLIIRDPDSPMIGCDPSVRRAPVPADEFNHPAA